VRIFTTWYGLSLSPGARTPATLRPETPTMTVPDESADDMRAIRAQLEKRTDTGHLPFYDQLTWETQNPNSQVPGTARTQLLFGCRQSDWKKVYALYFKNRYNPQTAIGYHEDGVSNVLPTSFMSQRTWSSFIPEPPFCHLRDSTFQDKHRRGMLAAYTKACFSLRGVSRGMSYNVSECFERLLGRAITTLCAIESGDGATSSSAGSTSQVKLRTTYI
jgi:hypothetical protein